MAQRVLAPREYAALFLVARHPHVARSLRDAREQDADALPVSLVIAGVPAGDWLVVEGIKEPELHRHRARTAAGLPGHEEVNPCCSGRIRASEGVDHQVMLVGDVTCVSRVVEPLTLAAVPRNVLRSAHTNETSPATFRQTRARRSSIENKVCSCTGQNRSLRSTISSG